MRQRVQLVLLCGLVLLGPREASAADEAARRPIPVSALAYRPDGKLLAVAGHGEFLLIDVASGDVVARLAGQTGRVTALAFSRDGLRLAVASGEASRSGEVRLYALPPGGLPIATPLQVLAGHKDLLYDLTFRADGKLLATCGYDRQIKLWDVDSGKEGLTLKDHSDTVYAVAFSPDGKQLASASADRAVKVWEVATGRRLYTLGDATDWLYALAWSPDGKHIAAAGVDKSIRVWEAGPESGRLVQSVFAHEKPVTRLAYSADGTALYSIGEDRIAKAWDAARMMERRTFPAQPETVLSLALRPDGKQLALGRFDGAVVLLDPATGQVQAQPLPEKPKPPQVASLTPAAGPRGQPVRVRFEGKHLEGVTEVTSSLSGVVTKLLPDQRTAGHIQAEVTFPASAGAGNYQLGLKSAVGASNTVPFSLDLFPLVAEAGGPNSSPMTGQKITVPASVAGNLDRAGDVDYYRFDAQAGQEIGVQVVPGSGTKLDPVLTLSDATGRVVAESMSASLGFKCSVAGAYAVGIRDREYGGGGMTYRLHVGPIPVVTVVFPLGLQRGTEADIQVEGVHLGGVNSVHVKAPADAAPGTRLPVPISTPLGTPLGNASVVVGEVPETANPATVLTAPATANGRIDQPGVTQTWRFHAKKGQTLVVETSAQRIGSPLDSVIEILDAQGRPVPRVTLHAVAKTIAVFRDHDSSSPGIRIEAWNDLAIDDYLYIGGELIKIRNLPPTPDDDCQFYQAEGRRAGQLETTPTHHSMGTPLYKVTLHPPGTMFPPNGLPQFTLPYRNDDGGPGYGKDSRLTFDPPADGEYQVRVADARGQGGPAYAYRLNVRPPRPDFTISFGPGSPAVWKGNAVVLNVTASRLDGFDGPIDVHLENMPSGFSAPATSIGAGQLTTSFALYAEPTAANPPAGAPPLKLIARAVVDGKPVIKESPGGLPKVVDPGDLLTTTEQAEVAVKPGHEVRVTAKIERRNGFAGRVPVSVSGLPHGVRVLDVGLNGILITEKETSRTFVIYVEPWVRPAEHPIVVLAKQEGKGTEHAAKAVVLKIEK